LQDKENNYWISCGKGIFSINYEDMENFLLGKIDKVTSISYGIEDGLITKDFNGGFQDVGIKTKDGKILFATSKGIVVLNDSFYKKKEKNPKPIIKEIFADFIKIPLNDNISLPAGTKKIEIYFSAISLGEAEKIKFKYKLEPFEKDWVDFKGLRKAYYTSLFPGNYSFKVIACNSKGKWNENGANINLRIKPLSNLLFLYPLFFPYFFFIFFNLLY